MPCAPSSCFRLCDTLGRCRDGSHLQEHLGLVAHTSDIATRRQVAARFVEARRAAKGFRDFPGGAMPPDLEAAYRVQSIAIAAWGDRGSSGPIFADSNAEAAATNDFPMTADGSALFEAEVVIVTKADARADKTDWTAEEAAELISAVHVGIEIAGSPLETINDLDPVASIAGFGNNSGNRRGMAGLLRTPEIAQIRLGSGGTYRCRQWSGWRYIVDGQLERHPTRATD
jgi:hypothetical protein